MSTQKTSLVPEEIVVPGLVGGGLLLIGLIVLRELMIVAVFFSIFTAIFGFGIGIATLPILYWTGLGYMPPTFTPEHRHQQHFSDVWPHHIVAAVYYSYLTGLVAITVSFRQVLFAPLFNNPTVIGVFSGIVVGILFALGQTWMTTEKGHRVSAQAILIWLFYGLILIIAGFNWDFFLGTPL